MVVNYNKSGRTLSSNGWKAKYNSIRRQRAIDRAWDNEGFYKTRQALQLQISNNQNREGREYIAEAAAEDIRYMYQSHFKRNPEYETCSAQEDYNESAEKYINSAEQTSYEKSPESIYNIKKDYEPTDK